LLLVGLTGGIASGKSEALAAAERLGVPVLSTDAVVHELLASDEVRDTLAQRWGETVTGGGEIDRGAVAALVFERPDELAWLEGVLFPRVGARMAEWKTALEQRADPPAIGVVEVPLLFEAGIAAAFDATIAVVADEKTRAERAAMRGHEALAGRAARQLSQEEKADRADYAVRNDGSIEDLERAMQEVLTSIAREQE
jgi:dephospho-CoA kinase